MPLTGRKMRETIEHATERAGALVTATLAIACTALLAALAALVIGLKVRHAGR